MSNQSGLRAIALLEAGKGVLVLTVGLGLLRLIHHDVQHLAEGLVRHFHLNPASSYPRILIQAAHQLNDARLFFLALGSLAYALFHLVEGYGLWKQRHWAEWLGTVSAALYIPIELFELIRGITALKIVLLGLNVGIVCYLAAAIRRRRIAAGDNAGVAAK
jgi:uncharacterized membrane protein (DUF2068 family)